MGCKAITPHLVSLAKRYEGSAFHLIASHCQNQPKESVVSYIRSQGVAADTPNFTVTSFGRHPKVKGNGYVPYYIVFDHHGNLVHHHMCGNYHGGDGLKMIDWVDKLMAKAPAIYLGQEPFEHATKLAKQVSKRSKLGTAVKTIEKQLAADSTSADLRADLKRLMTTVTAWRDKELARALALEASKPSRVVGSLSALAKELKGSSLAPAVEEQLAIKKKSTELKAAVAVEKSLRKLEKSFAKLTPCKPCRRTGAISHRASCSDCMKMNRKKLKALRSKAEKLTEEARGLAVMIRVEAFVGKAIRPIDEAMHRRRRMTATSPRLPSDVTASDPLLRLHRGISLEHPFGPAFLKLRERHAEDGAQRADLKVVERLTLVR